MSFVSNLRAAACASALLLAAAPALAEPAAATAPPAAAPSVEDFLARAAISSARLSPSGRYLAYVQRGAEADELLVVDLDQHTRRVIAHTGSSQHVVDDHPYHAVIRIMDAEWKGENRLIYRTRAEFDRRTTTKDHKEIRFFSSVEVVSIIDRDGTKLTPFKIKYNMAEVQPRLLDLLPGDPEHVLATVGDRRESLVLRVSVVDLSAEKIESTTEYVRDYLVDRKGALIGRIRWLGRSGAGWLMLEARAAGETAWTPVTELHSDDLKQLSDFELLAPAETPERFYVAAKPQKSEDGDTASIRVLDFKTRALGPVLAQRPDRDMDDIVLDDDGKLLAACYWDDVKRCDFTDKAMAAAMRGLDKFFSGERNVVVSSQSRDGQRWLLSVSGPDEKGSYYLFDRKAGKVELVGNRYPRLPIDSLGRMSRYQYRSRDGQVLSGYLTEPPGRGPNPPPLIVMPHGGPEVRDDFNYDTWVQFLASRGYAVFQPNFRGSGGFGRKFAEAGYRQWGGRMQDDVTDGVKALLASGKVDPKRVCILGASYGGYVALYAGATDPLYRCVISIAGDADLVRSLQWETSEHHEDKRRVEYWTKSIGDLKADREALEAKSPERMAARFTAPVLLIHGDSDPTVWVEQSRHMNAALKQAGKSVRYVELPDVGHSGWPSSVESQVLTEIESFLGEHLATSTAAPGADAIAKRAQ